MTIPLYTAIKASLHHHQIGWASTLANPTGCVPATSWPQTGARKRCSRRPNLCGHRPDHNQLHAPATSWPQTGARKRCSRRPLPVTRASARWQPLWWSLHGRPAPWCMVGANHAQVQTKWLYTTYTAYSILFTAYSKECRLLKRLCTRYCLLLVLLI